MSSYIGYSLDASIRYSATSGGVGSSLIKWLFEKKIIETSLTFEFDSTDLTFKPKVIYSFEEYRICGSIYQEIDLIGFIKANIKLIKGNFACFALPCQAKALRTIIERNNHKAYIIGLTCSSQQKKEATNYLLKRLSVSKDDVKSIQYRGNGWPSGIQITKKTGDTLFVSNNNSIWTKIFHSRLFIREKCFKCQMTLNPNSDITLADPWLPKYLSSERIGKSFIITNTTDGDRLLQECFSENYINLENVDLSEIQQSQMSTILRKSSYQHSKQAVQDFFLLINKSWFQRIVLRPFFFDIYIKRKEIFEYKLLKKIKK